ncbi:MAG: PIN domain-containing protein [Flavobacteriales bacterium]
MKALLDTNIIIHREAVTPSVHGDVGVLYRWLDRLKYEKCVHPSTVAEIGRHKDKKVVQTMAIKLQSYSKLLSIAPLADEVKRACGPMDKGANDEEDTKLINEVFVGRVDILITEDRKIHAKARALGIDLRVLTIERFLEQAIADHPDLIDYKVLSVRKQLFGEVDLQDPSSIRSARIMWILHSINGSRSDRTTMLMCIRRKTPFVDSCS